MAVVNPEVNALLIETVHLPLLARMEGVLTHAKDSVGRVLSALWLIIR